VGVEGETPDAKKVAVETPAEEMLLSQGRRRRSAAAAAALTRSTARS